MVNSSRIYKEKIRICIIIINENITNRLAGHWNIKFEVSIIQFICIAIIGGIYLNSTIDKMTISAMLAYNGKNLNECLAVRVSGVRSVLTARVL